MAGALMVLAGAGGSSGGGVITPGPLNWTAIYDTDSGATNTQAFTLIATVISVSASLSGGGILSYVLNGVSTNYTGAFAVHPGDALSWGVSVGHISKAGNLTVNNVTASTTLATIAYSVFSSWDGSGYH